MVGLGSRRRLSRERRGINRQRLWKKIESFIFYLISDVAPLNFKIFIEHCFSDTENCRNVFSTYNGVKGVFGECFQTTVFSF